MDDVVAVAVRLEDGTERFFLTWGRLQHVIDPAPLAAIVLRNAHRYALGGVPVGARVCWSLREARDAPYFYEGLLKMARRPIPFGRGYERWKTRMAAAIEAGNELVYLGAEHGPADPPLDVETDQET
jgi:hypothetical protein